jgi:hypothetical protein
MGFWAKLCCDEGVVLQKKFKTSAEASAFCAGLMAGIEEADEANNFYFTVVDTSAAKDEE